MSQMSIPDFNNSALPNSDQSFTGWLDDYLNERRPGWQQVKADNPQWGGSAFFNPKKGVTNDQAEFLQNIFMGYDLPRIQGAADRQHQIVANAIDKFGNRIDATSQDIRRTGDKETAYLKDAADHVGDVPLNYAQESVESAREGVRMSREMGDQAVQGSMAAVDSQLKLMRSGDNPDGSPMTAEQYAAVSQQVMYNSQVAGGQIRAQYDQSTIGMQAALSQSEAGAAGVATNVAQLASGLRETAAQLHTSTRLAAAQLEAQGHKDEALLLMQNPESVVSISNAFLSMWGVFMGGSSAMRASGGAAMGAAMSGAVTGAAAGTAVMPGWGTAAGAVIGGVGGYMSNR